METSSFDILMIDPPWAVKKGGIRKVRPRQGKNLDYITMPLNAIFRLLDDEIFNCASICHCVFMWTVEKYLTDCDKAMLDRGYKRHCRLIWDKSNGMAPCFTVRYTHEYLIWYYKPKLLPIAAAFRGIWRSVFQAKAREHSRKPDIAYKMVEDLYPEQKKIDVFSREKRNGWNQYGNQLDYFTN